MRALIVLLALVTTPFLTSVSQNLTGSPQSDAKAINGLGHDAAHCAARWALHPDREVINKCPTPAGDDGGTGDGTGSGDTGSGDTGGGDAGGGTGGGATCVDSPPTGSVSVRGQVYKDDGVDYPNLSAADGWCVELRDLSGAVVATAAPTAGFIDPVEMTNYVFTVQPGSYVVCEVLPPNTTWHQTWPRDNFACGARAGYLTGFLVAGATAGLNWFGNLP